MLAVTEYVNPILQESCLDHHPPAPAMDYALARPPSTPTEVRPARTPQGVDSYQQIDYPTSFVAAAAAADVKTSHS